MQMRVERDDAIEVVSQKRADRTLADRFSRMECCILAHVAKVRGDKNQPHGSVTPQSFSCEQQGYQLFIGEIERTADNRSRRGRADGRSQLSIGKSM
jgi:hypothetical protein